MERCARASRSADSATSRPVASTVSCSFPSGKCAAALDDLGQAGGRVILLLEQESGCTHRVGAGVRGTGYGRTRSLWFAGRGRLEWRAAPAPRLESESAALVKPVVASRCAIDRLIIAGDSPVTEPFPMGHEAVGEVVETGADVSRDQPEHRALPHHPAGRRLRLSHWRQLGRTVRRSCPGTGRRRDVDADPGPDRARRVRRRRGHARAHADPGAGLVGARAVPGRVRPGPRRFAGGLCRP